MQMSWRIPRGVFEKFGAKGSPLVCRLDGSCLLSLSHTRNGCLSQQCMSCLPPLLPLMLLLQISELSHQYFRNGPQTDIVEWQWIRDGRLFGRAKGGSFNQNLLLILCKIFKFIEMKADISRFYCYWIFLFEAEVYNTYYVQFYI